jgi:hypothetical protein
MILQNLCRLEQRAINNKKNQSVIFIIDVVTATPFFTDTFVVLIQGRMLIGLPVCTNQNTPQ